MVRSCHARVKSWGSSLSWGEEVSSGGQWLGQGRGSEVRLSICQKMGRVRPDLSLPPCLQVAAPGWGSQAAAGAWAARRGAGKAKSHFRPEW